MIQEWCNHWCIILTKLRLQSLVDSGLWTLPMVTWSCLGFLSDLVPTSTSLAWSMTESLPPRTMCVVLFPMSLREFVRWNWWNVYLWTPLCYFVTILHLFSQSLSIVLRCEGQLQNVFLSARCVQWPGFAVIRGSCHCVIDVVLLGLVCCTRLMQSCLLWSLSVLRTAICFF